MSGAFLAPEREAFPGLRSERRNQSSAPSIVPPVRSRRFSVSPTFGDPCSCLGSHIIFSGTRLHPLQRHRVDGRQAVLPEASTDRCHREQGLPNNHQSSRMPYIFNANLHSRPIRASIGTMTYDIQVTQVDLSKLFESINLPPIQAAKNGSSHAGPRCECLRIKLRRMRRGESRVRMAKVSCRDTHLSWPRFNASKST